MVGTNGLPLLLFSVLFLTSKPPSGRRIVCYYGSWATYRPGDGKFTPDDPDPFLCTHLIYAFVGLNENDGTIKSLDPWADLPPPVGKDGFGRFNALRKRNPKLKVMVAIGGWNEGSVKFSNMVHNEEQRATFVQDSVKFVKKYGFDGLDLDWEYPSQRGGKSSDKKMFVKLLQELRSKFDENGLLLSAAVGSSHAYATESYDVPALSKYLDFINLMTYDLHGTWESFTGHNAALYVGPKDTSEESKWLNANASVHNWLEHGALPEKINLGMPLYGHSFMLPSEKSVGTYAPSTGPGPAGPYTRQAGTLGYNEICDEQKGGGWTQQWDNIQDVPYTQLKNVWVSYDNPSSIKLKSQYLLSMNLGGAMVWSIETDDFRGICGSKNPLLETIHQVLVGNVPSPSTTPSTNGSTMPSVTPSTTAPVTTTINPAIYCNHAGNVPDPKNCSIYYVCENIHGEWKATKMECPAQLCFYEDENDCNYPRPHHLDVYVVNRI